MQSRCGFQNVNFPQKITRQKC